MITTESGSTQPRRIWVICEGKHESGGALQHLLHRILPSSIESEIVFEPWKNPRNANRRFRSSGKGDGVFKKFIAALIDAKSRGFHGVIGLVDCDRDRSRIRSVDQAQSESTIIFPRAFGVAIETFDAWFLADEVALSSYFGINVQAQPDPESCSDAKSVIKALRNSGELFDGLADCYSELAKIVDLEMMARRCPNGFAVWMQRVAKL